MCTFTKKGTPMSVASEDIRVYKAFGRDACGNHWTPYMGMDVDSVEDNTVMCPKEEMSVFRGDSYDHYGKGLLHASRELSDVRKAVTDLMGHNKVGKYAIFEMAIPAGARYVEDCDDSDVAATALRFVREVEIITRRDYEEMRRKEGLPCA